MNAKLMGYTAMLSVAILSACRGGDRAADTTADTAAVAASTSAADSTAREALMNQMHTHMVAMERASGDSARAMVPMHQRMLDDMIAQFDREMRGMNMPADAAWQATIDSLRQDNTRMQQMNATQLKAFIPTHHGRIMRFMASHRSMMSHKM